VRVTTLESRADQVKGPTDAVTSVPWLNAKAWTVMV
jgi:hypothetical protein